jgi:hypothetical protein
MDLPAQCRHSRGHELKILAHVFGSCDGPIASNSPGWVRRRRRRKSCESFAACGGNVVGNWTITSSCLSGNISDVSCPGAIVDVSGLSIAGAASFNSDMTYTSQSTLSGSMKTTLPPACLMQGDLTLTCEQYQQLLMQVIPDPESPFSGFSCKTSGSNCDCTFTFKATPSSEQGTYATAGNVLTMTAADGSSEADDYCVSGDKLQLKPMAMASMMDMDLTMVLTLTKQ